MFYVRSVVLFVWVALDCLFRSLWGFVPATGLLFFFRGGRYLKGFLCQFERGPCCASVGHLVFTTRVEGVARLAVVLRSSNFPRGKDLACGVEWSCRRICRDADDGIRSSVRFYVDGRL